MYKWINLLILIFWAGYLASWSWPTTIADVLGTLALIIFSMAAGIALLNLFRRGKNG
jgi:hypothetical protein